MSNIRIKDLTTTAATTASDDFVAVDGTTNGTRKLNAYSPSFGGNATVGGTLTASGSLVVSGKTTFGSSSSSAGTATIDSGGNYGLVLRGSTGAIADLTLTQDGGSIFLRNEVGTNNVVLPGIVKATGTTASTSTSTGALVVGNGTSGGLGVGGMISVNGGVGVGRYSAVSGGSARVDINGTGVSGFPQLMVSDTTGRQWEFRGVNASGSFVLDFWNGAGSRTNNLLTISAGGNLGVLGNLTVSGGTTTLTGTAYLDLDEASNRRWRVFPNGGIFTVRDMVAGVDYFKITGGSGAATFAGAVSVSSTTASTSTSSGALVVSGGVGVAGDTYIGGQLLVAGSGGIKFAASGTTGVIVAVGAGGLSLRDDGNNQLLNLADATGNAAFLGNITTAAPTGGTAAAWKLGTVASVSPTSPNRTIEVDIGGTIYYIHAKTTNN
jgi:hypothetical protein